VTVQHEVNICPQALYNIAKTSREAFLAFFPEVFDALFRLCADAEPNVKNAASFLDSFVKVSARAFTLLVLLSYGGTTSHVHVNNSRSAHFMTVLFARRIW